MTQSDLPDTDLDAIEPIDADFEPAPAPEDEPRTKRDSRGPGWMGAGILALMAAGTGGAIGLVADKPPFVSAKAAPDVSALQTQIKDLIEDQSRLDTSVTKMAQNSQDLESRLRTDLSALVDTGGDGANLSALITELDTVSKRLDDAMTAQPGSVTLSQLTDRISALESVDTSGETSTKDIARAIAGLGERLTALETTLADLPPPSVAATPESVSALETEIAALRSEFNTISSASSEDQNRVAALIEDMRTKEETALASAAQSQASTEAALALSAIETASARGDRFEADYRDLRAAMPESATVRALSAAATTPVPTLNDLRADFPALRAAAIKASPKPTEPGAVGWLNRTFGDAITVKPAKGEAGSTETRLDDASHALKSGELPAAIDALTALDTAPKDVFADWITSANARITLDTNLADLRQTMIEGGE